MRSWRPSEGWKNPYDYEGYAVVDSDSADVAYFLEARHIAFEAGADAIIEVLKKEGWRLDGQTKIPACAPYPEIILPGGMKGWLVFIEEEQP